MYKKGTIFNIQRFSTSDGPGIRTVVFLKGCPLNCTWCHNPESKQTGKEIFFKLVQCIGCGSCARVCPKNCHTFEKGHRYDRELCMQCGKCADNCFSKALELCGQEKNAAEIIRTVMRDEKFYSQSGGGLTLSGGEPLLQYDFSLELLTLAKDNGIHTVVETCGFTERDLTPMHKVTDLWLYDVKLFCDEMHRQYTGVSNGKILKNLYFLDSLGANIILRCPIIPNVNLNRTDFADLVQLANDLKNVKEIHLEPYHPLGISKAEQLGKMQIYQENTFLEREKLMPFVDILQASVKAPVVIL